MYIGALSLVVSLFQELDLACRNLRFYQEQGGWLNGRLQRLRPTVEELLGRHDLTEFHLAAVQALQLLLKKALTLFEECNGKTFYCFLNHRKIKEAIKGLEKGISACVLDILLIGRDAAGPPTRGLNESAVSRDSSSSSRRSFPRQESGICPLEPRIRPESTLNALRVGAEEGDILALFELGVCCAVPARGALYNTTQAFICFKEAADAGLPRACAFVAECLFFGVGVAVDQAEGVEYARKAEHLVEPAAKYVLAIAHKEGLGEVEKDQETATACFKAAKREYKQWAEEPVKDPLAQLGLGLCYFFGYGTRMDRNLGVEEVKKAADQGSAVANAFLGGHFKKEGEGGGADLAEAVRFYRRAAEQGHTIAQSAVGKMLLKGQGGSGSRQSRSEGMDWLKQAAAGGNVTAQLALAKCSTRKSDEVKYYAMAANHGLAEAQYQLGVRYVSGVGVEKDLDLGRAWLEKAAEQDHNEARASIGILDTRNTLTNLGNAVLGAGVVFVN